MHPSGGHLGLLGQHISYSLSPLIHQFASSYLGYPCRYELMECPSADLGARLADFWAAGGLGLNVTTPHKRAVASLLGLSNSSVNTLYRGSHYWQALSTDGHGFALALHRLGVELEHCQHMVILGSGGVVSAILAYLGELAGKGGHLPTMTVLRRRDHHDQELQQAFGHPQQQLQFGEFTLRALQEALPLGQSACLLVQASSAPQQGDDLARFKPALAGYRGALSELTYGASSALLAEAQRQGLRCQDGVGMLIEQARLAQQQWWGEAAPYEAIAARLVESGLVRGRP